MVTIKSNKRLNLVKKRLKQTIIRILEFEQLGDISLLHYIDATKILEPS